MRHTHRVILSAAALMELEQIARYIRERSPQSAASVADSILTAVDSLASLPDRFKCVGVSRKKNSRVHAMVVRPFIVYYRIDEQPKTVHVLSVMHGARLQPGRFE